MHLEEDPRQRRGRAAEELAAAYLQLRGYRILDRNVRAGGGEIDLVAIRADWIVFAEVRFRSDLRRGHPVETLQGRKSMALVRAAHAYLSARPGAPPCRRIDAVTVVLALDGTATVRQFANIAPLGTDPILARFRARFRSSPPRRANG